MKIHEYQAKGILARYGVPVPQGRVAHTAPAAMEAARELGEAPWVVKAQIHAGGRGKGGGVRLVKDRTELEEVAKSILGMQLVTHQTGPAGQEVKKILVEVGLDIERELYLGVVIDRSWMGMMIIFQLRRVLDPPCRSLAKHHPSEINCPASPLRDQELISTSRKSIHHLPSE